jgi:hypothetical protein
VKHKTVVESFKKCEVISGVGGTEGFVLLKKMKSWTVTIVMMSVLIVTILGNIMTTRNCVWHCPFVE